MSKTSKKTGQKEVLIKVFNYIKKYRIYLYISLILSFVTVLFTLYIPKLTGQAVDYMFGPSKVDFGGVMFIITKIMIFVIITSIGQWIINLCNNKMTYNVVRDIRNDAFHKIQEMPLSYLDSHAYGEIESKIINDAAQFADGLLMGFTQFFTGIVTIIGTLLFMLTVNVYITIVVVAITPLSFVVAGFISKKTFTMFKEQSIIRGEQTGYINEMIEGQRVIKAFDQKEKVIEKFDVINEKLRDKSLKATFYSSITNPSTRFINSLVYTGVGVFGALSVVSGRMSVGQLTAFLSYSNQYTKPFNEISGVITELQNAIACAASIFSFIEEKSQTPDSEDAIARDHFDGEVKIEGVSFSYVEGQKLIEDFNLEVKPGQNVAIVGPTGCGKTTLINLLMRFYDISKGAILVDGTDIRDIKRGSLRNGYGMVLQETWLKSGTIRENITMGNPDISDEDMRKIAKVCHIDSFIQKLPKKYDTIISENGEEFSHGQRQLLCIARVMMGKPSMMILDEATSSIDTRTEMKIQEAFNAMMEGRTSFVVAHRLSTIRNADIILVMKSGNVVEMGNHKELMERKGFYYDLYMSQFVGKAI
ncbi:ATP-binding cassette, subfamily B [Butyrivibrio fibrisolvens]|jgi:ATP-binding cassette subfamily B protein|uniref:ATP-binding cassette, subfamily B n=1 Tax=Butyrivibrio fibrisolvens TaxID=831 RepID=A0A1H9UN96_BUTFI|nr:MULTISPECIES: ABC transporter ATP-binding protein [Butyrivibrio]SES10936.1 ATP-binding cassette, subfamily B [Butyrivibrio fibrisolvens]